MAWADRVTIQRDVSAAGDSDPSYHDDVPYVPARIQQISGDESFRGRQLEGHIDYVITIRRQVVSNTSRIKIMTGFARDRLLNVDWVREISQANGKPPIMELYCTEVNATYP